MGLLDRVYNPYDDYRRNQQNKVNTAIQEAMPGSEEVALSGSLEGLVQQATQDRNSTRNLILGEMGFKTVTDANGNPSIVPLTDQERRSMMSPIEANRSQASQIYADRAKAAFEGTTQLPPFLQKTFDSQKAAEDEVRTQLLGEHSGNAAAQQAMEQLKKRERNVRFNLQQQDKMGAFAASKGLSDMNAADKSTRISSYGSLPGYAAPSIASSAGLLNYMQQKRTGQLDSRLTNLSLDNQQLMQLLGAGGTVAGMAGIGLLKKPSSGVNYA